MFVLAEKTHDEIAKHVGGKLKGTGPNGIAVNEKSVEQIAKIPMKIHQMMKRVELEENIPEVEKFAQEVEKRQPRQRMALLNSKVLIETRGDVPN